jgi:ABC-type multidrug transport system fused ATPase/permease subunit
VNVADLHENDNPADVYAAELQRLVATQAAERRRERIFGYSKLAIAVLTLTAAALVYRHAVLLAMLLAPVALFIALAIMQEKLLQSTRYRTRAMAFYDRGLARLTDEWSGSGETGDRFLDPVHPYARDLDLFGPSSLFEYLSTARTRAGEETLAQWLLHAAAAGEIEARQAAVRELRARVTFRERLFCAGETVRLGVHPDALSAWGESEPVFAKPGVRIVIAVLAILWAWSLVAWAMWDMPVAALLMTFLNFAYSHLIHARLEKAAARLENATRDLTLLAEVLSILEQEPVSSARLVAVKAGLRRKETPPPSAAISKLARIVDLLESRHSLFARPLDLVTFWSTQLVFSAERWQREFGPSIRGWLDAVGEFEAFTSLSSFAYEHPYYAFPEFAREGPLFDGEGIAHPLLPAGKAVVNDVTLGKPLQLIVLSGPNMAGKSTFIRAIGINAVLAQCGAPVRARSLRMSPLQVAASICVLDSLAGGVSRFYAEIHRVKLIADLVQGAVPVFFLLDELLSGTNSHDRRIGTEFVLREFVEHSAIGVVSTHDLALAEIPLAFGERAANFHFEDQIEDGRLSFDYKLKRGIVETSNALKLMRAIGLGVKDQAVSE